jgi:hypothetical protein
MKIPPDATIEPSKLTQYLLVERPVDDKSKFLARAGFRRSDPALLEAAIRQLAAEIEAVEDGTNPYGTFLKVEGRIIGPNGRSLEVALIWLRAADGSVHFVTLKPSSKKQ